MVGAGGEGGDLTGAVGGGFEEVDEGVVGGADELVVAGEPDFDGDAREGEFVVGGAGGVVGAEGLVGAVGVEVVEEGGAEGGGEGEAEVAGEVGVGVGGVVGGGVEAGFGGACGEGAGGEGEGGGADAEGGGLGVVEAVLTGVVVAGAVAGEGDEGVQRGTGGEH